jgi:hypothetical protein
MLVAVSSMPRRARAAALIAASVSLVPAARAEVDGDAFALELWGWTVELTSPRNWIPSEERSYPSILLWMVRRDPPGKMLLSAEKLDGVKGAFDYATRTTQLLEALGFAVRDPQLHGPTGAYWIDFDNGRVYLRQAFLVVGGVGYALTLSARDSRTRGSHLRAFDAALRSIHIRRVKPVESVEPAAPQPEAANTP